MSTRRLPVILFVSRFECTLYPVMYCLVCLWWPRRFVINLCLPAYHYLMSFYFVGYTKYRESIAFAQKIDFQILMNVHVLRATESKKVIFGMSSVCVCLSVCLSVATITQKIIELAQPNLACDRI